MVDCKRCARCGEVKPTTEFPPSKQKSDGLFPYCRSCKRESTRLSAAKHAVRRRAEARAKYAADPERKKANRKRRYYEDPARAVREAAAWNAANPDKRRATAKKWRDANLQGLVRESVRRRYATRKGAPSIKFSPAQLGQRADYYGRVCWVCRVAEMSEWDHVKPLTKGGWHCLANLRPICRTCNARKRNKWPFVVAEKSERGMGSS